MRRLQTVLSPTLWDAIESVAQALDVPINDLVRNVLSDVFLGEFDQRLQAQIDLWHRNNDYDQD